MQGEGKGYLGLIRPHPTFLEKSPGDPGGFFFSLNPAPGWNIGFSMERSVNDSVAIDVVCGVIRDDSGRYLACRRPQDKHLGGLWEFPGGKVDLGETPENALVRELEEELEIGVDVGERLAEVRWHYDVTTIRLIPFFCRIRTGEPVPVEHTEIRWCAPHAFAELDWAPADLPVLDQLIVNEFPPSNPGITPRMAC